MDQKQGKNSDTSTRPYIFSSLISNPTRSWIYSCGDVATYRRGSNTRQGAHHFSLPTPLFSNQQTVRPGRKDASWGSDGRAVDRRATEWKPHLQCKGQASRHHWLTTKSLVVLFLSFVLFVEEPWRMKLRLNVFMVVTEDASMFSAKRKQMEISGTQKLGQVLRKKDQVSPWPRFWFQIWHLIPVHRSDCRSF